MKTDKQTHHKHVPEAQRKLDVEVVMSLLFAGRTTVLFALLATIVATAVITVATPRRYESSVKLIAEPRRDPQNLMNEVRSYQDRKVFLETQKELIVSKTVISRTLAQLEKSDPGKVTQAQIEKLADKVSLHTRASLGRSLVGGSGIGENSAFFVTARDGNPEEASRIANTVVEVYLQLNTELQKTQTKQATVSIQSSVDESARNVKEAHAALVAYESEAGPLLPELMNIDKDNVRVFPELETLRSSYEETQVELAEREARAEALKSAFEETEEGEFPALPPDVVENVPALRTLMAKVLELSLRVNELLPYYLEESREVSSLRDQIELTRLELMNLAKQLYASEMQGVAMLEATQKARAESLLRYDEKLSQLSRMNSTYQELKRDYEAKARTLDNQLESLALAESAAAESFGGQANITIIDRAEPIYQLVSPRPLLNMLVAVIVGFILGILLVLLAHFTRPVFVHPRQVEEITGLPVVGILNEEQN